MSWLTTREVADRLGLSIRTVQNWRSRGVGPKYSSKYIGKKKEVSYSLKVVKLFEKSYKVSQGVRL